MIEAPVAVHGEASAAICESANRRAAGSVLMASLSNAKQRMALVTGCSEIRRPAQTQRMKNPVGFLVGLVFGARSAMTPPCEVGRAAVGDARQHQCLPRVTDIGSDYPESSFRLHIAQANRIMSPSSVWRPAVALRGSSSAMREARSVAGRGKVVGPNLHVLCIAEVLGKLVDVPVLGPRVELVEPCDVP